MTNNRVHLGIFRMLVTGCTATVTAFLFVSALEAYNGILVLYGGITAGGLMLVTGFVMAMLMRGVYKWLCHEFKKDKLTKK